MIPLQVETNVAYTQAKGAWGCVHIGSVAIYLLWSAGRRSGWRLELFTPTRRFRWSVVGGVRR